MIPFEATATGRFIYNLKKSVGDMIKKIKSSTGTSLVSLNRVIVPSLEDIFIVCVITILFGMMMLLVAIVGIALII